MTNKGRLARLHYLPGTFRVLSHGDHVVCAVTRQPIPLADLKYWSVERQEAYAQRRSLAAGGRQGLSAAMEASGRCSPRPPRRGAQGRPEAAAELLEALVEGEPRPCHRAQHAGDDRAQPPAMPRPRSPISSARPRPSRASRRSGSTCTRPWSWPATPERALASLDRALAIDPNYLPAIVMKARPPRPARPRRRIRSALFRAIVAAGPDRREPSRAGAPGSSRAGLELVRGRRRTARRRVGRADRRSPRRLSRCRLRAGRGLCRAADRPPQGLCAAAGRRPFPLSARDRILPAGAFPLARRARGEDRGDQAASCCSLLGGARPGLPALCRLRSDAAGQSMGGAQP